jgi:hypothetical protein
MDLVILTCAKLKSVGYGNRYGSGIKIGIILPIPPDLLEEKLWD